MRKVALFTMLLSFFLTAFTYGRDKVLITCSEQDAKIYVDGVLVGTGSTKISVGSNECVNVKIVKVGFLTVEKNYCDKRGVSLPDKDFIKLEVDDAFTSSVSTDIANVDIVIRVANPNDDSWKILNSVILTYFDVIELTDKETSYLRTAWAVQSFKSGIVRTRVIIKGDQNGYRAKLVSELSNSLTSTVKNDEAFHEWERVLRKYEALITDLQSRLK
jgi:hypothetical protein